MQIVHVLLEWRRISMDTSKLHNKDVSYIKNEIVQGRLLPGSKLPTERELASSLSMSRNSIREGLRVLENIGIITPVQGSGNYISLNFDETMSEMLSFMYFLKGIDEEQVIEFRWMIEEEALKLSVHRMKEEDIKALKTNLSALIASKNEEEKIQYDQMLHSTIVNACGNDFLIANYNAFTSFMDSHIKSMRQRIVRGMESSHLLEEAHRKMVEGLIQSDLDLSLQGLHDHFGYIEQYKK